MQNKKNKKNRLLRITFLQLFISKTAIVETLTRHFWASLAMQVARAPAPLYTNKVGSRLILLPGASRSVIFNFDIMKYVYVGPL